MIKTASVQDIDRRIGTVADALHTALLPVVQAVAGASAPPARLVRELSLDKSLASRLVRSLRADSPLQLIDLIPSPIGLRIVIDAAEQRGVGTRLIARARQSIDQFENLIQDIPGGRNSLDALLSTTVPEVRVRSERSAKQTVYRAMVQLLGLRCDAVTSALILQPAAKGRFADALDLQHRIGMRHLRPNTPVAVHSLMYETEDGGKGPRVGPLDPALPGADPGSYLLPEFCTDPLPPLRTYRDGPQSILALDETRLALHTPVTISTGCIARNGYIRYTQPDFREEWRSYLLPYPTKLVIRDLYIRDDLYPGSLPEVRLEFPLPPGARRISSRSLPKQLSQLDIAAPIEQLGSGLSGAGIPSVPAHRKMVEHAFERTGWDPGRFRGYRCRIEYPVPMIAMGWWIPLPEEPRSATGRRQASTAPRRRAVPSPAAVIDEEE